MSLSSSVSRVGYIGAGTTSTFSFPFKIFDPTELLIANVVVSTGVQTTLVLNTDYTVSGVGQTNGGSITLTAGNLGIGTNLVIVRKRTLVQNTDLRNQGDYYPEVVEDTFDQLVMNDQQIQRELNNAIKLPLTTDPTLFNPTLPSLTPANASLVISSTGAGFAMGPTSDQLNAGILAGQQAATSATAAATSASGAATSATNAATSATQASGYSSSASTSATSSQSSATQAQSLAQQASTSATNAGQSATSANTSAQNAASSQTSASTSASNASTSATNAANSATSAANSASAAQQSAQVIPTGGTAGQILLKKSSTNYDTQWATNQAGITQLTGDVTTASGSGSQAATISGLSRSKLAPDTAAANVYNDANGNLASEAQVAKVRGGTAQDNTNVTFPASGTIGTVPASGFVKSSGSAFSSQSAINLGNSDVTGTLPVSAGGTGTTSLPAAGFVKSSGTALSSVSAITLSSDTTGILPTGNGGTGQNSTATFPTSGTVGVVPAAGFVKSASGQLTSQTSISLTSDVSGTLPVGSGGTGATSLPAAGFVKSSGTALTSQSAVNIASSDVTGTLPIGSGGTGATSIASGFVTSTGSALSSKSAIALTTDVTGALPVANGGTALTSAPSAGFVTSSGTAYGSKASVALTTDVSGTLPLANGGTALTAAPAAGFVTSTGSAYSSKSSVVLTSDVSGTLPIASGGTGQTTASAALNALLPTQSTAGQVLTTNGTTTSFATPFTSPLTTKGDLHGFSTTDTRIPAGATGQLLTYDSTQTTGIKWAFPATAGGKNYLGTVNGTSLNGDFENGTTSSWSLFNTTLTNLIPTAAPSAGANSITTFAATNTTPLAGTYSLNVASTGAITAGQGFISAARTIDLTDQARMISFSFSYKVMSGAANLNLSGTSANSFQIYAYDLTNAVWIQPAGVYNIVQSSGVGVATGTFQTSSNGTQYQFAVLCVNATAGAAQVYFDNFAMGPQSAGAIGFAGGDLVSAGVNIITATTTAPVKGTVSNDLVRYRRVGDHAHVKGEYKQTAAGSGTTGTGDYLFQLPTGLSFDPNKCTYYTTVLGGSATWLTQIGLGSAALSGGGTTNHAGTVIPYDATHFRIASINNVSSGSSAGTTGVVSATYCALSQASVTISYDFMAPIAGWSSNAVQSSDTDTRVISFTGSASSYAASANTAIPLTVVQDRAGAWSTNQFIVPTPGDYVMAVGGTLSVAGSYFYGYYNGALAPNAYSSQAPSAGNAASGTFFFPNCKAQDKLSVVSSTASTVSLTCSIFRLSGPATVQATESVNATYGLTTAQSVAANAVIKYDTKVKDTHNAFATATGLWTSPRSGQLRVSICCAFSAGASASVYLKVNGAGAGYFCLQNSGTTAGGISVPILAGQTAGVYIDAANTATAPAAQGFTNQVTFEITGN